MPQPAHCPLVRWDVYIPPGVHGLVADVYPLIVETVSFSSVYRYRKNFALLAGQGSCKEQYYFRDASEESGTLPLIKTCRGTPDVQRGDLHNLLRKSYLIVSHLTVSSCEVSSTPVFCETSLCGAKLEDSTAQGALEELSPKEQGDWQITPSEARGEQLRPW